MRIELLICKDKGPKMKIEMNKRRNLWTKLNRKQKSSRSQSPKEAITRPITFCGPERQLPKKLNLDRPA